MGESTDNHTQKCLHRIAIAKKHNKCDRCHPHGGENRKRTDRAKPKSKEHR